MDESVLGSEVQRINKLTLITDLGFAEFAEALQNGLADSLKDRPKKVDVKLFVDRILTNANGDEVKVTEDLANAIYEDLIQSGYVKRGELTDRYYVTSSMNFLMFCSSARGHIINTSSVSTTMYSFRPLMTATLPLGSETMLLRVS